MFSKLNRLLKILLLFITVIACEVTHALVSDLESQNLVPEVEVLFPSSTYVSDDNLITVFGTCVSGATVVMEGDSHRATLCVSNQFSFDVKKHTDGSYVFHIWQKVEGDESKSVHINWVKHSD